MSMTWMFIIIDIHSKSRLYDLVYQSGHNVVRHCERRRLTHAPASHVDYEKRAARFSISMHAACVNFLFL